VLIIDDRAPVAVVLECKPGTGRPYIIDPPFLTDTACRSSAHSAFC
jgi:hypothetical protein